MSHLHHPNLDSYYHTLPQIIKMEWSHDFCLSCDRQIPEGAYCSQACRLADLERAGTPEPSSPSSSSSSLNSPTWRATGTGSLNSGFYLPPALDFSAYRSHSSHNDSVPSSPSGYQSQRPTHSSRPFSGQSSSTSAGGAGHYGVNENSSRTLSPSSSRLSLSSLTSAAPTIQALSDQAASYLRCYANSFDQIRSTKRRLTLA